MLNDLQLAEPGAALVSRLSGFAGFLRANGFDVGGGDAPRILDVAHRVGVLDRQVLRWSLKALLCGRGDEWRRFDELFDAWFMPPNKAVYSRAASAGTGRGGMPQLADGQRSGEATADTLPERVASREESLARADFRELTRREHLLDIEALMRRFARRLKRMVLRREARVRHGSRLDLQSTIRQSVASGGTPLRLAWKDRRRVRPRLVLLVDVSRSMSLYGFFYLRLARALSAELAGVHCYIFHTRITGVSEALRDPDPWRSQERLHLLAAGWAGGTRIGESLAQFNREHAPRIVHSRTAIVIASDGYDTGDPDVLAGALSALRRRARRIVWLNPLCRQPGWSPESIGMRAALPHLDLLAPGAGLSDIEQALPQIIQSLRCRPSCDSTRLLVK
jgi:uncharacterized protein with von Willebrand factor type A (vWA) domain